MKLLARDCAFVALGGLVVAATAVGLATRHRSPTSQEARRALPPPPLASPSAPPPAVPAPPPAPKRVVIISEDGLRPDALSPELTPRHIALIHEGARAKDAETIPESDTLPSHASMLSGVGAREHGLWWNSYQAARGFIHVPTIFSVAHDKGLSTAMFVGKPKLRHIAIPARSTTSNGRATCAAAWPSARASTSRRASPI